VEIELTKLPDFFALEHLAKSLWRDGETRGAALLLGSGFSRFARLPGGESKQPPLWNDLRRGMLNEIYAGAAETDVPADPLRLAEEFRAMLGQAALDDFIRQNVPDASWEPSELHERLLRLPWADVLTTNWDTLLERTAPKVTDSNYETVSVATDIARAKQPRIVKLHGTLPSGPFIFAEEDYRTYPTKHAAFVNLARQIFLENELCLLGFSGNDPNFLQWSGWVRDHLGGGARKIYLVGVLRLPTAARRLLEQRNVVPIDLAPAVKNLDRANHHAKAIELFLGFLQAAEPKPLHDWPPDRLSPQTMVDHDRLMKDKAFAAEEMTQAAILWRSERESYPGWLVCPNDKRHVIRNGTDAIPLRRDVIDEIPPTERPRVLYELAWRFEKSFWPIPPFLLEVFAEICQLPIPSGLTLTEHLDLALVVLRAAREANDSDRFDKIAEFLGSKADPRSDIPAAVSYQRCLWLRDRLQYVELAKNVGAIEGPDPIWKLRRASIHCELGEAPIAKKLIVEALAELRLRQQRDRRSLWILSRRAWAEYLARAADMDFESSLSEKRGYGLKRDWPVDYKAAKCDPWDELQYVGHQIDQHIRETTTDNLDLKPHFEAGTFTEGGTGTRFRSWTIVSPDYELDRLAEDAALPLLIGWVGIRAPVAKKALILSFEPTSIWYSRFLQTLHSHNDDLVERYLGRVPVAKLDSDVARELVEKIVASIEYWRGRYSYSKYDTSSKSFNTHAIEEIRFFVEALSRLVVRTDGPRAMQLYELALNLITNLNLLHWWHLEPIGHLMQRAVEAIPPSERGKLALSAVKFLLSDEGGVSGIQRDWPQPLSYLGGCNLVRSDEQAGAWGSRIAELIRSVEHSKDDARGQAILRLCILDEHKLLRADEAVAFGKALYSRVDAQGIPRDTNLYCFMFLRLPAPDPSVAKNYFNDVVFKTPAPLTYETIVAIKGAAYKPLVGDATLLPPRDESLKLLDALLSLKEVAASDSPFNFERATQRRLAREIGPCIFYAVLPSLSTADITESRVDNIFRLISELAAFSVLKILPAIVRLRPELEDRAAKSIALSLFASEFDPVSGAAAAIIHWAELPTKAPAIPRRLVDLLILAIETRQEGSLLNLIWCARRLLKLGTFNEKDKNALVEALADLFATTTYDKVGSTRLLVSLSVVRAECVRLAKQLSDAGFSGTGVKLWLESYAIDPLPEVRFALETRELESTVEES
jgi:hypothetical protein